MKKQIEDYKAANVNDFIIAAAEKILPSLDYRVVWQESQNAIVHKKKYELQAFQDGDGPLQK